MFFFSGGEGGRGTLLFCVYSNSFLRLQKKKIEAQFIRMSSNSFVCLPPQKKPEPQFIRMSSNSFIYIPKKNAASQFLRLYSNSFVCLPIHSYVFSAGMVGGGRGWWVEGGGAIIFIYFFSGGEGGRGTLLFCVYSNSFLRLRKKKMKPNSFVCLPIHSYVFPPKRSLNPNSFVCLQIHSYIFQKKTLHLNSFVCIPIHSYVFQFIRMSSRRGWWVEGGDGGWRGGERLYLFIFSRGGGGARNIIILCVFQCIRMSSNK